MSLPTTPGPYWWRAKDGDEWELVILDKNRHPWNEDAYNMGPLSDMQGQWAKVHRPDDGRTLTHDETEFIIESLEERYQPAPLDPMGKAWQEGVNEESEKLVKLFRTCEPVTIFRKEKE